MKKDVLISIRSNWIDKICNKIDDAEYKKTLEMRKGKPTDILYPFKCYIYETKSYGKKETKTGYSTYGTVRGGNVIGEFLCDNILTFCKDPTMNDYFIPDDYLEQSCLSNEELWNYGKGKPVYGWHISNLKIYDKPKELSEFKFPCKQEVGKVRQCWACNLGDVAQMICDRTIKRPPQSWCYVEYLGEKEND